MILESVSDGHNWKLMAGNPLSHQLAAELAGSLGTRRFSLRRIGIDHAQTTSAKRKRASCCPHIRDSQLNRLRLGNAFCGGDRDYNLA